MTSRRWVFTLNNYTLEEVEAIDKMDVNVCNYLIYGREHQNDGTPHLQGFMKLKKPMRLTGVKKIPGLRRAHFEVAKASDQDCIDYCSKEDISPYTLGTLTSQGKRTDLESVADSIGTLTLRQIAEEFPVAYIKYHKGINELKKFHEIDRNWKMEVWVIWGPPGTGKTRFANTLGESQYFVSTPRSGKEIWFDGYEGQETMILDDFYGWMRWSMLIKLLDRYKMGLPIKGGFVSMRSKRIVITSNSHPLLWYNYGSKIVFSALARRTTHFVEYGEGENRREWLYPSDFNEGTFQH